MKLLQRLRILLDVVYRDLTIVGQARSIMSGKAVDAQGNPVPWLNYAANDLIRELIASRTLTNVFEFGSGQSTLFFAKQDSVRYTGVETDRTYYRMMGLDAGADYFLNVLFREKGDHSVIADLLDEAQPDLIIVDSDLESRPGHLKLALDHMTHRTIVLVDDANWLDAELQSAISEQMTKGYTMMAFSLVSSAPCVSYQKSVALIARTPRAFDFLGSFPKPTAGVDVPPGWTIGMAGKS